MVNPGQKTLLISTEIDQIIVYNRSKPLNKYPQKSDHQGMTKKKVHKTGLTIGSCGFLFEE